MLAHWTLYESWTVSNGAGWHKYPNCWPTRLQNSASCHTFVKSLGGLCQDPIVLPYGPPPYSKSRSILSWILWSWLNAHPCKSYGTRRCRAHVMVESEIYVLLLFMVVSHEQIRFCGEWLILLRFSCLYSHWCSPRGIPTDVFLAHKGRPQKENVAGWCFRIRSAVSRP